MYVSILLYELNVLLQLRKFSLQMMQSTSKENSTY